MLVFIVIFCAIIALGFGAAAAWSDANRLIIPNIYSVFVIGVFAPAFLAAHFLAPDVSYFSSFKSHIIAVLLVFVVTYILFFLKILGGGDSKLMSVFALWTGVAGLTPYLFYMALTGALLSIVTLSLRKWKPLKSPKKDSWLDKAQQGANDVPYGIAIFVGAVMSFWQIGYLKPDMLAELANASSIGGS